MRRARSAPHHGGSVAMRDVSCGAATSALGASVEYVSSCDVETLDVKKSGDPIYRRTCGATWRIMD